MISVGQVFGSGLQQFWLRVAHEFTAKYLLGWQSPESSSWAGGSTSEVARSQAWQVGAVGRRPQFQSTGPLHRTAGVSSCSPQSEQSERTRQKLQKPCMVALEVHHTGHP